MCSPRMLMIVSLIYEFCCRSKSSAVVETGHKTSDGYINFVEYIAAISLMLKGEINQKLKWYFKLFDQDGNGKIDKEELETIFTAIQDITRNKDIDPEEIVSLIFEKIDVKGEGELTLEEFIEGAKDHEDIMDMLKTLMDLTPVLLIIIEGRTGNNQ
ncbi:guanylate cyclase activator 1d isoform X2 [Pelmatolapia mariae]|uniref:guanylate cyclase activator 1d isoform X2 n=1 Tax=Pelmatolapia mariae TaxID=158779 RepID=UPI002FE691E0